MNKVFLLGIDGANFKIIKRLIKQNHLPNIKRLLENGASGILKSILPYASTPAWPCFYTGKNPGKLGFYYHVRDIPGSYKKEFVFININEDIWTQASRYGKTVGVFNVPGTYPPKPVNGFLVSGFIFPQGSQYAYPKSIIDLLGKDYRVDFPEYLRSKEKKREQIINSRAKEIIEYTDILFKKYKPDLFTSVYDITDVTQHTFLHFYDKDHPLFKKSKFSRVLPRIYGILDDYIGRLIKELDENTILLIISDHGFTHAEKNIFLNKFFLDKKLLNLKGDSITSKSNLKLNKLRDILTKIAIKTNIRSIIPTKLKEKIKVSLKDIDWNSSICFAGFVGSIFVNKKLYSNKEEYNSLCKKIKTLLLDLKDPKNNKKIIKDVYLKEEIFWGEHLDKMPDILAIPSDGYILRGDIRTDLYEKSELTGTHNQEGIFIAYGKDIRKTSFKEMNLLDVAPTILHILDIPIPESMDGKVRKYIFSKDSPLYKKKIKYE